MAYFVRKREKLHLHKNTLKRYFYINFLIFREDILNLKTKVHQNLITFKIIQKTEHFTDYFSRKLNRKINPLDSDCVFG